MRTIIAGSRDITDYALVAQAVTDSGFHITEVVSGCARGVDLLGERYALEHNLPVARFPADWDTHGRAAGPIRNSQMAAYAEALIAIRKNGSRGTTHMIEVALRKGLKVFAVDLCGRGSGSEVVRLER